MTRLGLVLAAGAATVALTVTAGLAMGGPDFVRQHFGVLAAAAALLVLVALLLGQLGARLRGATRSLRRRPTLGQSGAAAAEFVIVVIPFLLLLFGVMQLALASLARVLVSYAAFCAARAAIVFVPESPAAELANQVGAGGNQRQDFAGSAKMALLRNAAAYALIPASPALDSVIADPLARARVAGADESVARALDHGLGDGDGAGGALARALRKLPWARVATAVTLHDPKSGAYQSRFAWGDPITARVTYLFYCQIPLANRVAGHRFFALPGQALQDLATGPLGTVAAVGVPGYFMALTAEHTLTNQGRP